MNKGVFTASDLKWMGQEPRVTYHAAYTYTGGGGSMSDAYETEAEAAQALVRDVDAHLARNPDQKIVAYGVIKRTSVMAIEVL